MEIDRRILVFDGPGGELQQLALTLIGHEFEVHYANDLDEAQILVREHKGRINAVLVSSATQMPTIPDMIRRFDVSPSALISIGPRPSDRVVEALHFHGVRWQLWDDPPDESIRLILASVLFEQDPLEIRYHLRVPTNLAAQVEIDGQKFDTTIRDLSQGGACLFGGVCGKEGSEGSLRLTESDDEIDLPIRIAWCVEDENEALRVAGVTFVEVGVAEGAVLDRLIESVVAKHRISKPV